MISGIKFDDSSPLRLLTNLGSRALSLSAIVYLSLIVVLTIMKWGLWPTRWLVDASESRWLHPLPALATQVTGLDQASTPAIALWIVGTVTGLSGLVVLFWQISQVDRSRLASRIGILLIAVSPVTGVLLGITRWAPDSIHIVGISLFILLRKNPWSFFWLGIATLSHPEQSSVAIVLVLLMSFTSTTTIYPRKALFGLLVTFSLVLLLRLTEFTRGFRSIRADDLGTAWNDNLIDFLSNSPAALYSSLSVSWIVVISWLWIHRQERMVWMLPITIIISFTLMAITSDGTRVFIGVFCGVLIILIADITRWASQSGQSSETSSGIKLYFGALILIAVVFPLSVWSFSEIVFGGPPFVYIFSA